MGEVDDPYLGQLIADRYRISRRIGEGGLGVVYLAEHVLIQKQVAIKMLRQRATATDTRVEDLLNEARTAAKVRDDHIVDITDFGRTEAGDVFLVMEYLEGRSLAEELFEHTRLPVARVLDICDQLCSALTLAHTVDVIHCDLKPDNIFLVEKPRRSDFVKILDFGMSAIRQIGAKPMEDGELRGGTPEYMAPEQIRGMPVDAGFDIYATGCIIYELLTGAPPFSSPNGKEVMMRHLNEAVVPPSQRSPEANIPPDLEAVVMRALEKDRAQRFQTVRQLGLALAACRDPLSGARLVRRLDSDLTGVFRESVPSTAPAKRQPRVWQFVVALVLTLVAGGAWWSARAQRLATERAAAERAAAERAAAERAAAAARSKPAEGPGDAAERERAKRDAFANAAGMVPVGSFYVDRTAFPNPSGGTLTHIDWSAAKDLCERGGKRLCSDAEWEAGCQAQALVVPRDVLEWTSTPFRKGAPQIVVRGASTKQSPSACGLRDYFMPGLGGARHVGFRCCY